MQVKPTKTFAAKPIKPMISNTQQCSTLEKYENKFRQKMYSSLPNKCVCGKYCSFLQAKNVGG